MSSILGTVVLAPTSTIHGGAWRHVRDLALGLSEQDVRVRLLLPPEARELAENAAHLGLESIRIRDVEQNDLLHLHLADTFDRAATSRLLGARRRGAHTVITEHLPRTSASDPTIARAPTRMGSYRAKTTFKLTQYALAHRVIALSEGARQFLLERYPVEGGTVVTIGNGIAAAGHSHPPPHDVPAVDGIDAVDGIAAVQAVDDTAAIAVPRFVATGSVIDQKGFDVLVAAAYKAAVDWTVDLYGEGATELAAALDTLECAPVLAQRMGLACCQRVQTEFGLDRMVSQTLELYRDVRQTLSRVPVGGRR